MKKIKRLVIFLCVISCMTMLCSCGNKSKIKAGFNYDKDELVSTTVSYIYAFDQAIKNDKNKSAGTSSENAQLTKDSTRRKKLQSHIFWQWTNSKSY